MDEVELSDVERERGRRERSWVGNRVHKKATFATLF